MNNNINKDISNIFALNLRNLSRFLVFILISFITLTCKHDAEKPILDVTPSIEFINSLTFVYGNDTLNKSTPFKVCIKATSSPNIDKPLTKLVITRIINDISSIVVDSAINTKTFNYIFTFNTLSYTTTEKWIFKIFDADNNSKEISFNITTIAYPPEINIIFKNIPYSVSSPFMVAINATSNRTTYKNIKRFIINRVFEGNLFIMLDSVIDTRNLNYFNTYITNSSAGSERWTFKVIDKGNESDSIYIDVNTGNFMNDEQSGYIWNSLSSNSYAWDLIANLPKTTSDPNSVKDMANNTIYDNDDNTIDNAYPPYYFDNGWCAMNSSLFKKANWYDYENSSVETAVDAFTGGTIGAMPKPTAIGVTEGDIFIGKLRNINKYTIIKITKVDFTVSDNSDKIEFIYKK